MNAFVLAPPPNTINGTWGWSIYGVYAWSNW